MARQATALAPQPDHFHREPMPQLGNLDEDKWLRKQFNWKDIEHRIKTGQLLDVVYDFEATDLKQMFAAPTQFSGKVVTLDGRIIDKIKLDIQVPEDIAVSPQAAVVTKAKPDELYSAEGRDSPHIAAAKILLFFRNPYRALWDQLADTAITIKRGNKKEEVRVYTITDPDHTKTAEIRIHNGGKFLSYRYPDEERLPDGGTTYRDADGTRWKKIDAPAVTEGHNIRRFDDRLLWEFLHREMSDEVFLTHTKKFHRFRVDTLDLAKLVALLDKGGQNSFQAGTKIDPESGQSYKAFNLSSLMEANKHDAIPGAGVEEGIRMPDGSEYDQERAHINPAYDVDATIALKAYLRKRAPEVVRSVEENADFGRIKPFLMGTKKFEKRPLLAFARNVYKDGASLHFGVCVNINEQVKERRQALLVRTDFDRPIEEYTYSIHGQDKKLLEMSTEELAAMLKSQSGKADALFEVIDLRKNPPVVSADMAFDIGLGGDREKHQVVRRFMNAHEDFCKRLMRAQTIAMPDIIDYKSIPNPQAEEHLFTSLAEAKEPRFELNGEKVKLPDVVFARWKEALEHNRRIDSVLRRAIKPQTIEFEYRLDTLEAFIERMEAVDKALQKYKVDLKIDARNNGVDNPFKILPAPEKPFMPPKWDYVQSTETKAENGLKRVRHVVTEEECKELTDNAREYVWKLRAELMYQFRDNTTQFKVQKNLGDKEHAVWHDVPFAALKNMPKKDLGDYLRKGEYRINMESLNWSSELVARMFRDANRVEWVKSYMAERGREDDVHVWEQWEEFFAALRALRMHGAPHLETKDQRWMTAQKVLEDATRILKNSKEGKDISPDDDDGAWGLGDIFNRNRDKAEEILAACIEAAKRQLEENPFTPDKQRTMGYDPDKRGLPIEYPKYVVPADAKILTIDVPDAMLDHPLHHDRISHKFLMLDPTEEQRAALASAGRDTVIFLRGAQTGRTYLAPKAFILSSKVINPEMSRFKEVYDAAAKRFRNSGMDAPDPERLLPMAVDALEPIPTQVDLAVPTIKVPSWDHFIATVSPLLGNRGRGAPPLTGLVIRDYGTTPTVGPVRLQGMVDDRVKKGQTESGWEVPTEVTGVRTLTLKEVINLIDTGFQQTRTAIALGYNTVEELREALTTESIPEEKIAATKLENLDALKTLMAKESFTNGDAIHYGYAGGLKDMKSDLTLLFVNDKLDPDRDDNRLHFVDIKPADKEKKMDYHQPNQRPRVEVLGGKAMEGPSVSAPSAPESPPDVGGGGEEVGREETRWRQVVGGENNPNTLEEQPSQAAKIKHRGHGSHHHK